VIDCLDQTREDPWIFTGRDFQAPLAGNRFLFAPWRRMTLPLLVIRLQIFFFAGFLL